MINVIIPIPSECVITDMTVFTVMFVGGISIVVLLFVITQQKSSVLYAIFFGVQLIFIIGILTAMFIIAPRYPNYDYCSSASMTQLNGNDVLIKITMREDGGEIGYDTISSTIYHYIDLSETWVDHSIYIYLGGPDGEGSGVFTIKFDNLY